MFRALQGCKPLGKALSGSQSCSLRMRMVVLSPYQNLAGSKTSVRCSVCAALWVEEGASLEGVQAHLNAEPFLPSLSPYPWVWRLLAASRCLWSVPTAQAP